MHTTHARSQVMAAAASGSSAGRTTRVPAGLGAFVMAARACGLGAWTASARGHAVAPDGSVACSFGLSPTSTTASSLHIEQLLVRPIGGGRMAAAPTSTAGPSMPEQLLYAVAWQASAPAGLRLWRLCARTALHWELGGVATACLPTTPGPASSFGVLQASLGLLQYAVASAARLPVGLHQQLPVPGLRGLCPGPAAAAALLKVAAAESRGQRFSLIAHDGHTAAAAALQHGATGTDAFGERESGVCSWGHKGRGLSGCRQACAAHSLPQPALCVPQVVRCTHRSWLRCPRRRR